MTSDTTELREAVRTAIKDAAVETGDIAMFGKPDTRSLSYYASVGIDYFGHPHERLDRLFDVAADAALLAMQPANASRAR